MTPRKKKPSRNIEVWRHHSPIVEPVDHSLRIEIGLAFGGNALFKHDMLRVAAKISLQLARIAEPQS